MQFLSGCGLEAAARIQRSSQHRIDPFSRYAHSKTVSWRGSCSHGSNHDTRQLPWRFIQQQNRGIQLMSDDEVEIAIPIQIARRQRSTNPFRSKVFTRLHSHVGKLSILIIAKQMGWHAIRLGPGKTAIFNVAISDGQIEPPVVINEPESNTGITPEINQIVKMIGMKQEELKTLAAGQPELYRQFSNDLDQLDSSYNALKSELNETPNQELLLEAMIQNLQLQLNVLNQQLNIINQIKQSKKYSHEKKDQSI